MNEGRRSEYNKRYYQAHKLELSEKRKAARLAKLAGMSEEERAACLASDAYGTHPIAAMMNLPEGAPSPKSAEAVFDYFDGKIHGILDGGPCTVGVESTILDLTGAEPKILREGGIPGEELLRFLEEA